MILREQGKVQEALSLFQEAARKDPTWSIPFYNVGLIYKYQGKWEESLDQNRRATELDPKDQGAWWNLGIAATALGRWDVARHAWQAYGLDIPPGEGPITLDAGVCPVRLNPNGDAEVVWAVRLDPARAEINSIPFPESGYRWKDIVLNDGAAVGFRFYQGQEVPVFNVLQLLQPSSFSTFVAQVAMPPTSKPPDKLSEIAVHRDGNAEDWSTSTRILCKACSEGRPHKAHDKEAAPPEGSHVIGIAAKNRQHAQEILDAWVYSTDNIQVESLEEALGPGAT